MRHSELIGFFAALALLGAGIVIAQVDWSGGGTERAAMLSEDLP